MTTTREAAREEAWSRDDALSAFLAVTARPDPDDGTSSLIVLDDAQLARLRPVVERARRVGYCLQCDPGFPEVWAAVGDGWPHLASSHGKVRSRRRTLTLRPMNRPPGDGVVKYEQTDLCFGGRQVTKPVHQILLLAFEGTRPSDKHESCHGDDVANHNHWTNLRYGLDNGLDKARQAAFLSPGAAERRSAAARRAQRAGRQRLDDRRAADRATHRDDDTQRSGLAKVTGWLARHGMWRRGDR
jgi:hypothetical protein